MRSSLFVFLAAVAAIASSCALPTEGSHAPSRVVLDGVASDSAVAGELAPSPLVVRVLDERDRGVRGATVSFRALSGDGTVSRSVVTTDGAGRASVTLTMGPRVGVQSFQARVDGVPPVTIDVRARPGAPAVVRVFGGDAQEDTAAHPLPYPLVVIVTDAHGNAVPSAAVTWQVAAGTGTLGSASSATDSTGLSRMTYVLGAVPGADTVTARVATVATAAAFVVRGLARTAAAMQVTAGAGQAATAGSAIGVAPAVRLLDAAGAPVAGAVVEFSVTHGAIEPHSVTTDANGEARLTTWVVGQRAGADTLTAVNGAVSSRVIATVNPGAAAMLLVTQQPPPAVASSRTFSQAMLVSVSDSFGNPVSYPPVEATVAVLDGVGTLAGTTTVTTVNGVATFADLRVSGGGPHRLRVTSPGLAAATTSVFTAIVAPISVAVTPAVAIVDSGQGAPLAVEVTDSAGVVVAGAQLATRSRDTTLARAARDSVWGRAPGSAVIVSVSTVDATKSDSALVIVARPGSPLLLTDLASLRVRADSTISILVRVDARGGTAPGSGVVTMTWPTAALAYQGSVAAGSVALVVNDANAGTGLLRFAWAEPDGLSGDGGLLRVTFRASSSASSGTVRLATTELNGAPAPFASLTQQTVAVRHPLSVLP